MNLTRSKIIKDSLRREIEDDVIFRASDVSRSSRQFWSMTKDGDRLHRYKQFASWSEKDVKSFLADSVKKLLFEVAFLGFRAGMQQSAALRMVNSAHEKHCDTDPLA